MNYIYFITVVLSWGSTWLGIQFQLGVVSPLWSVVYRFSLAAVILLIFCIITRRNLRFTAMQHRAIALQGLLIFSVNYILEYVASQYFTSGLMSTVFALLTIANIINSRIFFKTPLSSQVILSTVLGLGGLALIFGSQFHFLFVTQSGLHRFYLGLGISILAVLVCSLGDIISSHNQHAKQLPIIQSSAIGMVYGSAFVSILALFFGIRPTFDFSFKYITSLFYLTFAGTILACYAYLKLLGRIGPERVAYVFVLLPLVALALSTEFEGFHWTLTAFIGIGLILGGNTLLLLPVSAKPKLSKVIEYQ
jgi:drug/metabolite transporter (DMT)-like permease